MSILKGKTGRITAEQINAASNVANQFKNIVALAEVIVEAGSLMQNEDQIRTNILALNKDVAKAKGELSAVQGNVTAAKVALSNTKKSSEKLDAEDADWEEKDKRRKQSQQRDIDAHAILIQKNKTEVAEAHGSIDKANLKAKDIISSANDIMEAALNAKKEADVVTSQVNKKRVELADLEKTINDARIAAKATIEGISRNL